MRKLKNLTVSMRSCGGRNNQGIITLRNRGGGNKKRYRIVDYYRDMDNIVGEVISIDYDPNRRVKIALISYMNGMIGYIIAVLGMKIGDKIKGGDAVGLNFGDTVKLKDVPMGMFVHNLEIIKNNGGQIARAAGTYLQVLRRKGQLVYVKLRSKELRVVSSECRVTLGKVSSVNEKFNKFNKAGENRWRGKKPVVRGVAKNPVDHPHGGGQGKTKGGRCSVSPWGMLTKGYVTRSKGKRNRSIIKSRRYLKLS
jgi:large subunit ribosomal protein L2